MVRKLFGSKGKRVKKSAVGLRKYIPHICVLAVCIGSILFGIWWIFVYENEDAAARSEYDELREIFTTTPLRPEVPQNNDEETEEETEPFEEEPEQVEFNSLEELARINPDFVGWLSIENRIEYPVVRGTNNDKYMYTTFSGERNPAGAIFMDYRNYNGFDNHVVIIFGHRTRTGMMFSPLNNYLNRDFLMDNPIITITTRDGEELVYRIFSAKLTDAWDDAYEMSFSDSARASSAFPNAPADASRFLLLSTCTPSENREERTIVFAALEE